MPTTFSESASPNSTKGWMKLIPSLGSRRSSSNGAQVQPLDSLEDTFTQWVVVPSPTSPAQLPQPPLNLDPLKPLRQWLDGLSIQDRKFAHTLCKLIPSQCPFEQDVVVFGKTLFHIPPLCKLNPFYDEFVSLRFRALSYLADDCGEDISPYYR